jgi:hypothetical protein
VDRKKLLPYLLGATILVPLIVEGGTFLGLIQHHLLGTDSAPVSEKRDREGSGPGDTVLPTTPPEEQLKKLVIHYTEGRWTFHCVLDVDNRATNKTYEYRFLGPGRNDTLIKKTDLVRSARAGKRSVLQVEWTLTPGTMPEFIKVAVNDAESGSTIGTYRIELADVPVKYDP